MLQKASTPEEQIRELFNKIHYYHSKAIPLVHYENCDKLKKFLDETPTLSPEDRHQAIEYIMLWRKEYSDILQMNSKKVDDGVMCAKAQFEDLYKAICVISDSAVTIQKSNAKSKVEQSVAMFKVKQITS